MTSTIARVKTAVSTVAGSSSVTLGIGVLALPLVLTPVTFVVGLRVGQELLGPGFGSFTIVGAIQLIAAYVFVDAILLFVSPLMTAIVVVAARGEDDGGNGGFQVWDGDPPHADAGGDDADGGRLAAARDWVGSVWAVYPRLLLGGATYRVATVLVAALSLPLLVVAYVAVGTPLEYLLHLLGVERSPLVSVVPVIGVGIVGVWLVRWLCATAWGYADLATLEGRRGLDALRTSRGALASTPRGALAHGTVVAGLSALPFGVSVVALVVVGIATGSLQAAVGTAALSVLLLAPVSYAVRTVYKVRAFDEGIDPGLELPSAPLVDARPSLRSWPVALAALLVLGMAAGGTYVRVADVRPDSGPPGSPAGKDPGVAVQTAVGSTLDADHVMTSQSFVVNGTTGNRTPRLHSVHRYDADDRQYVEYTRVGNETEGGYFVSYVGEAIRARYTGSVPGDVEDPVAAAGSDPTYWESTVGSGPATDFSPLGFRIERTSPSDWQVLNRTGDTVVYGLTSREAYDSMAPYVRHVDEDTPIRGDVRVHVDADTGYVVRIEESYVYDYAIRDDEEDLRYRARVTRFESVGNTEVSRPEGLGPRRPLELLVDFLQY